jgi:CheY-like chemotaxis protein
VLDAEDQKQAATRKRYDRSSLRLDGLRVLVVEDDDDSRSLVSMVLKQYGADVTAAASAAEALKALEGASTDVVISDIGMPDEDGYELMRKVRALPPQRGGLAPAIALTGYATRKDRERALLAGYQMHVAKPVEPIALVAAVANLAKRVD